MMKAIRVAATGGVDKMIYESIAKPIVSKETDVLVKNEYIGVNFIDTYHRSGLYKLPMPFTLGREGSGVVESIGSSVTSVSVGDRVCYFSGESYAEYTLVPEQSIFKLPSNVDFKSGAAYPLQGMTGHYLVRSTFKLGPGHTCLIQAGAGGLGQILIQMANILGAKVITTVSTDEKEEICRKLGAHVVINYAKGNNLEELSKLVKAETEGGLGVDVVYDGVGLSTWKQSLQSLKPLGMLCLVGNASGPVPPIDPLLLSANGSLFVTRPTLAHYIAGKGQLSSRLSEIFSWVEQGKLTLSDPTIINLSDASKAHEQLEGRTSKGKILLKP